MNLSNDARKHAVAVFNSMRIHKISKLRAICYWNDDEGHLEEEISVTMDWDASNFLSIWSMRDIHELNDLLWEIDEYGIFEIDAINHTISVVGEAWVPEPELKTKMYDGPRDITTVDIDNPFLPLVTYYDSGQFDGPLGHMWQDFVAIPTRLSGRHVVIDQSFINWPIGTKVDDIVTWFNHGASKRFKVTYNK